MVIETSVVAGKKGAGAFKTGAKVGNVTVTLAECAWLLLVLIHV